MSGHLASMLLQLSARRVAELITKEMMKQRPLRFDLKKAQEIWDRLIKEQWFRDWLKEMAKK